MSGYPDNNPKTAIGATKVPLHLVPASATYYLALAFEDGARKYGPYNWRHDPVSVSTYLGAARRHIDAFADGEDESQDARLHHLAHAMACFAIVLDAGAVGTLIDDRPPAGATARLHAQYKADRRAPAYGELIPHEIAMAALRDKAMADDDTPCTCPSGDGSLRWPCPPHHDQNPVSPIGAQSGTPISQQDEE